MKKQSLKSLTPRLSVCLVVLITGFIIHGCKKDSSKTEPVINNPEVAMAKTWYESTYPGTESTGVKVLNRSLNKTNNAANNGIFDFSQHIKPNWEHALTYTRFNKKTVEIPIDPSAKLGIALKNNNTGQETLKRENSKSSFLLINDGTNYHAYIMTIIADASYLKNDKSKLARNTYDKRDADFTGILLYFTPKGKLLYRYTYKDGKLVTGATANHLTAIQQGTSVKTSRAKMRDMQICIDWYVVDYWDGVPVSSEYIGTTCTGDGSGTPDFTSGGGGSGGSDPGFPPPPQIKIFGLNGANVIISAGNFSAFLSYLQSLGYTYTAPSPTELYYDGVLYQGEITYIVDPANPDVAIAAYFTPDVGSTTFQTGFEYAVGVTAGSLTITASTPYGSETVNGLDIFGDPGTHLDTSPGAIIYPPPGGVNTSQIITDNDVASSSYINDGKTAIDPQKYINCFNDGKIASGYKLTIYVAQPKPGANDQWTTSLNVTSPTPTGHLYMTPGGQILNVGHTFVAFEKDNTDGTSVTQVMGFYPGPGALAGLQSKGVIKDDSNHPYNVSYSVNVLVSQFNAALNSLLNDYSNSNYVLTSLQFAQERNCTDAAINWMADAGVPLPIASRGVFVNSPGDFGQALKNVSGANSNTGVAPQGHGPCN